MNLRYLIAETLQAYGCLAADLFFLFPERGEGEGEGRGRGVGEGRQGEDASWVYGGYNTHEIRASTCSLLLQMV
jgi:hypothetical protein